MSPAPAVRHLVQHTTPTLTLTIRHCSSLFSSGGVIRSEARSLGSGARRGR